jgi:hypothetical protein
MTDAADLAGSPWVNFVDGDTDAYCLVLNQCYEAGPLSIVNALV